MTAEETLKIWKEWKKFIDDLGLDACVLNAMSEYKDAELKEARELIEKGINTYHLVSWREKALAWVNKQDTEDKQ